MPGVYRVPCKCGASYMGADGEVSEYQDPKAQAACQAGTDRELGDCTELLGAGTSSLGPLQSFSALKAGRHE